jgi:hypothetical protein
MPHRINQIFNAITYILIDNRIRNLETKTLTAVESKIIDYYKAV